MRNGVARWMDVWHFQGWLFHFKCVIFSFFFLSYLFLKFSSHIIQYFIYRRPTLPFRRNLYQEPHESAIKKITLMNSKSESWIGLEFDDNPPVPPSIGSPSSCKSIYYACSASSSPRFWKESGFCYFNYRTSPGSIFSSP